VPSILRLLRKSFAIFFRSEPFETTLSRVQPAGKILVPVDFLVAGMDGA
jgi:hypothetical protein